MVPSLYGNSAALSTITILFLITILEIFEEAVCAFVVYVVQSRDYENLSLESMLRYYFLVEPQRETA